MINYSIIKDKKECKVKINTDELTLKELRKLYLEIENEMCFINYEIEKGYKGR